MNTTKDIINKLYVLEYQAIIICTPIAFWSSDKGFTFTRKSEF